MNKKKIERFKDFLVARGAEVLIPTNEYELVRFRVNGSGASIIYTGKRGESFTGEALPAWEAFENNKPWTGGNRVVQRIQNRSVKSRTIRSRDGDNCFYCNIPVPFEDESLEHLLSQVHGGTNHVSNLVLAHKKCNADVGHLPIIEKIKIREFKKENKNAGI